MMIRPYRAQVPTDRIETDPQAELDICLSRWRFQAHCYSVGGNEYDLFGVDSDNLEHAYSDRLGQSNSERERFAAKLSHSLHPAYSAARYELYLSVYFGQPILLKHVKGGINEGNGFPYQRFGFHRSDNPNDTADLERVIRNYCEKNGLNYDDLPRAGNDQIETDPSDQDISVERIALHQVMRHSENPATSPERRRFFKLLAAIGLLPFDTNRK